MIGSRVRWKHLHSDKAHPNYGKPVVDCEGIVRGLQLNQNGLFLILIEKDDGTFAQQQALDMCLIGSPPMAAPDLAEVTEWRRQGTAIWAKIEELDLMDQTGGGETLDAAVCHLLDSFMKELTEAGETILTLQAEVGKKTKAKKEPKGSECACGQKFRSAEDFRDHLPCDLLEAAKKA